jgi:hypothetical protein
MIILFAGTARRLGGFRGVTMKLQRQVPGDQTQLAGVDPLFLDLLET